MKVKLKRNFKIGSLEATLAYKDNIKLDDGWRGYYNQRTGEMHIDPMGGITRDRTFSHEVIHMIDLNYECGLSEENISRLANGLDEFLKNVLGIEFDWSCITRDVDK